MSRHRRHRAPRRVSLELLEDRRLPAVLTVNTTADDTTADSTLSLREAIELVDGTLAYSALSSQEQAQVSGSLTDSPDTIDFNISGSGVHTITPSSALPAITVPVTIDGYSQPGASPNIRANGDTAVLLIQISGTNAGSNANGLTLSGGNSVVRGLVINNFGAGATGSTASAIEIDQKGGDVIAGNFIGVDPTGTTAKSNGNAGINIVGTPGNTVGGTDPADRNIISSFGNTCITVQSMTSQDTSGSLIEGNYLGVDHTGAAALTAPSSSSQANGILLQNAAQVTIGGTTAGAGNVISGGFQSGIAINGVYGGPGSGESTGDNLIEGNRIGTDAGGTVALGNNTGISILDSTGNTIGGTTAGASNLISGCRLEGIFIRASSSNPLKTQVVNNLIGTDATGTPDLGNGAGIIIAASGNTIGGLDKSEGNTIADSTSHGTLSSFGGGVDFTDLGTSPSTSGVASGNLVLSNAIYANQGPAIGYGDLDSDPIPPDLLIGVTTATASSQTTDVTGRLVGAPNTTYTLQFFTIPTSSPYQGGQAQSLLGAATVTTDGTGQAHYHVTLNQAAASSSWITATATGGTSNTSELSSPVKLGGTLQDVPADFTRTGNTETGTFDPATAVWHIDRSPIGLFQPTFGGTGGIDVPVPGDYDGLGYAEQAVYRPSTRQWFVLGPNGGRLLTTFGGPGDIPVPGDYDGVGYTEPAVFRPSTAQWFVLGPNGGHLLTTFGAPNLTDLPAPADYDGVGHAEPAVYRPSTGQWFALGPNGGKLEGTFGGPGDLPAPGAYNQAGHIELAVFRPSAAEWFVLETSGGVLLGPSNPGEVPIVGAAGSLESHAFAPKAQTSNAVASRPPTLIVSGLATQTSSQTAPLMIPLVPTSEAASPLQPILQTAGRKASS